MARVSVTNNGTAVWLPSGSQLGAVYLGCHLYDAANKQELQHDYHWEPLAPRESERSILPQETAAFEMKLPAPPAGRYVLEFDLVSHGIGWFALYGSEVARAHLQVRAAP